MSYKYILLDVDNTLLDFSFAEKNAHKITSEFFNILWNEEVYKYYHKINDAWWKRLERGEYTRDEITINRFKEYFEYLNVNVDPNLFNKTFLSNLALGKKTIDGANYLVKALYDSGFKLYIATNGITKVQQNRLSGQEFIKYITDIFVSEDLKAQKPSKLFFENASKKTGLIFNHQTTLIIGDSLTSDILGGNNAGIDTMWFNPNNLENTIGVKINYIVKSLYEIPNILIK